MASTVTLFVVSLLTGEMDAFRDMSLAACQAHRAAIMGTAALETVKALDPTAPPFAQLDQNLAISAAIQRARLAQERLIAECLEAR